MDNYNYLEEFKSRLINEITQEFHLKVKELPDWFDGGKHGSWTTWLSFRLQSKFDESSFKFCDLLVMLEKYIDQEAMVSPKINMMKPWIPHFVGISNVIADAISKLYHEIYNELLDNLHDFDNSGDNSQAIQEFEQAYAALESLLTEGLFNKDNSQHRIWVGTLITNSEVDEKKADYMLNKVKVFADEN